MNTKQQIPIYIPEGCLADGSIRDAKYCIKLLQDIAIGLNIKADVISEQDIAIEWQDDAIYELLDLINDELNKHDIDLIIEFHSGYLMAMPKAWWNENELY